MAMTSDTLTSDTQCFKYDYLQDLTEGWTPADANCSEAASVAGLGGAAPYWDSYTVDPTTGNRVTETLHGAAAGGVDVDDAYYYPAEGTSQPHALQSMQQTVGGSASTGTYAYDADGDMTTRLGQTITYDPNGRVSTISDGTNTESDVYDADGNLLLQADSATGWTLFNGADELRVATGSSTVTGTRTYSLDGVTIAERTTAAGVSGSVLTWQVADAQDTINLEVDALSGTLTYRAQDPFGNARGTVPSWTDDRGFLDAPTSSFSGLTQLGARLYDPAIGKFLSVDPVLDPTDPAQNNGYDYAHNGPVTSDDPTGLDPADYWSSSTAPTTPYKPPGTPAAAGNKRTIGGSSASGSGSYDPGAALRTRMRNQALGVGMPPPGAEIVQTNPYEDVQLPPPHWLDGALAAENIVLFGVSAVEIAPSLGLDTPVVAAQDGTVLSLEAPEIQAAAQQDAQIASSDAEQDASDEPTSQVQTNRDNGNAARDEIFSRYPGGTADTEVYHATPWGPRFEDVETDTGAATESKVGYTTLTARVRSEVDKDHWLLQNGGITSSTWSFQASPVTGQLGASKPLLDYLARSGITPVYDYH